MKCEGDMVFGVHWENQPGKRIDIDLSLLNLSGTKFGWDGLYRDSDILFSGDMTDAKLPKGATELFYVNRQEPGFYAMFANYFNYSASVPVPIDLFVASEKIKNLQKNYMVDPNNVIASAKTVLTRKQTLLGLIEVDSSGSVFYFSQTDLGNGITVSNNEITKLAMSYLMQYTKQQLSLASILNQSGAILVSDPKEADIDLSTSNLEKDSIINLLTA